MYNVLIIGGTGSLGRALTKKLLANDFVARVCIYSRDEHKHENMQQIFKDDRMRYFIGDIRDKDRLRLAINGGMTHIINTAALKIVPSGEYNPFEHLKTNVLGVQNLIDCVVEHNNYPLKVMQISTDKAVRPINLYGATKLVAEKLMIAANSIKGEYGSKFSVVRYGNVANSNGSVIPLFMRQLVDSGPLTVTDKRMTRFWITLDEASHFILEKLNTMKGGETFIPEMRSFRVIDLAKAMCVTHGCDLEYTITGIRPGEKLHEAITDDLTSDNNGEYMSVNELVERIGAL